MPHWDANSPELRDNLVRALRAVATHAAERRTITLDVIKAWHSVTMRGLDIPEAADLGVAPGDLVGEFRGPPKLGEIEVRFLDRWGTPSDQVAEHCEEFIGVLQAIVDGLDRALPADQLDRMDVDLRRAAVEAAAWAHGEWVRIHPFGNGNGRTARMLGNAILMRYGLPPVFRMRPRPEGSYAFAAAASMDSDHLPMADFVLDQLNRWRPR